MRRSESANSRVMAPASLVACGSSTGSHSAIGVASPLAAAFAAGNGVAKSVDTGLYSSSASTCRSREESDSSGVRRRWRDWAWIPVAEIGR